MVSEVEFAWRESSVDSRWVAITGTNGKTTTTSLTAHVLASAGIAAVACGNIGDACITAVAEGSADVYVAEVSSYQLASTCRFAPDVAVLLNITPDHVKWHRTLENYAQAKYKVLANLDRAGGVAVLDAVNDVVREGQVKRLRALTREERGFDYVPVGCAAGLSASMRDACGSENAAFLDDGTLRVDFRGEEHRLMPAADLRIKGEHNASNALAAASACLALGLTASRWRPACVASRRSSTASSHAAPSPALRATTTPRPPTSTPRSRRFPPSAMRARSCCSAATTRAPT